MKVVSAPDKREGHYHMRISNNSTQIAVAASMLTAWIVLVVVLFIVVRLHAPFAPPLYVVLLLDVAAVVLFVATIVHATRTTKVKEIGIAKRVLIVVVFNIAWVGAYWFVRLWSGWTSPDSHVSHGPN